MKIPSSYKNLTLKEFIKVKTIELQCRSREATVAALITYYTGKAIADIDLTWLKIYRYRVNRLLDSWESVKRAKVKPTIWIGTKRYKGITDATKLNTNQFTTIQSLLKDGQGDKNINRLAALIFYRYKFGTTPEFNDKYYEEISEAMLSAKVGDIAPTVFFYAKVLERLQPILKYYFLKSQTEIDAIIAELIVEIPGLDSKKSMVGITH
jgi:hypothetical protein